MRVRSAMFVAALAFAFTFTACSDSLVGTDDGASTPVLAKGGNGGGGGGGKPGGGDDPTDFRPVTVTFDDNANNGIRSDASLRTDTEYSGPAYADGTCGVMANVGNLNDARLDPDWNYKGKKMARACGPARVLMFEFGNDQFGVERAHRDFGAFMNIDGLDAMAENETKPTTAQFNICNTLVFSNVSATRTSETEWTVTTAEAGDVAVCADGKEYHMPFTLTITEQ